MQHRLDVPFEVPPALDRVPRLALDDADRVADGLAGVRAHRPRLVLELRERQPPSLHEVLLDEQHGRDEAHEEEQRAERGGALALAALRAVVGAHRAAAASVALRGPDCCVSAVAARLLRELCCQ